MSSEADFYNEHGYRVLDSGLAAMKAAIREEFRQVFDAAARGNSLPSIDCDSDNMRLYRGKHRDVWVAAYDQLRQLPALLQLASHPKIREMACASGVAFPALGSRIVVRADMPDDPDWAFPAHQDFVYNLGSQNSVTIWIPFQDVQEEHGPLQVVPGSHRDGVSPYDEHGHLVEVDPQAFVGVPMRCGECLVFSQFLKHRSGLNRSDRIRFSAQLRFSDLASTEYARRRFYQNKPTYTLPKIDFPTSFDPV